MAVMAARLTEVKGQKYLVEAAKRLREKGVNAKFLIAGTGETEAALRQQIQEYGLEETVFLLGFVADVTPLMHLMDVQVNCSFGTEATSLALLEGMSIGKPIVASDFGGNPGVVKDGENGFLTPTHNVEVLADRLETLFTNEEVYRKMAKRAEEFYRERFTALANTKAIEKLYGETIQKKGRMGNEKEV